MNASCPAAPRFFWQGVFIVLPVIVLAGAGLFSLRQDHAPDPGPGPPEPGVSCG